MDAMFNFTRACAGIGIVFAIFIPVTFWLQALVGG